MKKYLPFALMLLLICCMGCKKDVTVSDSLTGTWELRQDIIGITGSSIYHKAGNDKPPQHSKKISDGKSLQLSKKLGAEK